MTQQPQPIGTTSESPSVVDESAEDLSGRQPTGDAPTVAGRSPGRMAWERLKRDRVSIAAVVISAIFVVVANTAPLLTAITGWGPITPDNKAIDPNSGNFPIGSLAASSPTHLPGANPGTAIDLLPAWVTGLRPSLVFGLASP